MGRFRGVELDGLRLDGERLVLRPWAPDDAGRVAAVMQDRTMHRFLALPDPYTAADAEQFVTEIARTPRAEGSGLECAVVERSSGRVVGAAALRLAGDPEIGYWIAPDAQGNGYAAEATSMLTDWGFGVGLPRILLACDVGNLASARSALAAGFRFEGVARNGVIGGGVGSAPERRADLARFARLANDPPGRLAYAFPPVGEAGLADDGSWSAGLRLRPVRGADAPSLAETEDELTLRWNFTGAPQPAEEARREAEQAGLNWLVGSVAIFAIIDVATGRVAGSVRLRKAGPPQVGGIGYVVHPDFRGRGYTARALSLLVPWAFEVADFARLELGAKVGNEASIRAAAAAGFEADGLRRARLRNVDGTFSDELRFALTRPD